MKKLSVVIPTIGRIVPLVDALSVFSQQVKKNSDRVELIVVDNGSKDKTKEILEDISYSWLSYYRYEERVDYYPSISRAVNHSTGEYILLFGDDDIPCSFFIDYILSLLDYHGNLGILHYNVLMGKDFGDNRFHNLKIEYGEYESELLISKIDEMLYSHPISLSFISSVVFNRNVWKRGVEKFNNDFIGYPHLFIWYNGIGQDDCLYSALPLVFGRLPYNGDYIDRWPSYFLIEIPTLMKKIDDLGITDHLWAVWQNTTDARSIFKYINTLLMASAFKRKYRPLCKEINKHQESRFRKLLTYLIIYLVPSGVYGYLRKKLYKQG